MDNIEEAHKSINTKGGTKSGTVTLAFGLLVDG